MAREMSWPTSMGHIWGIAQSDCRVFEWHRREGTPHRKGNERDENMSVHFKFSRMSRAFAAGALSLSLVIALPPRWPARRSTWAPTSRARATPSTVARKTPQTATSSSLALSRLLRARRTGVAKTAPIRILPRTSRVRPRAPRSAIPTCVTCPPIGMTRLNPIPRRASTKRESP